MADVLLHPDVDDDLDAIQDDIEDRVRDKLKDAGQNPGHHLKPLKGSSNHRLRIGDYRVIIDWDKQNGELRALEFGKRPNIYD